MILCLRAGAEVAPFHAMQRKWSALAASLLFAAVVSACTGGSGEPLDPTPEPSPASSDAPAAPPPSTPKSTCRPGTLDVHKSAAGFVDRIHARVDALGKTGPFLVDTGTSRTFALRTSSADDTYNTPAVIACRSTMIPVFDNQGMGTTPEGEPQSGRLGVDLLARGAYDLDLRAGTFFWTDTTPAKPARAVVLALEPRDGFLVASGVRVDGRDTKLIVDTGAHNILVMSDVERPGETASIATDGTGKEFTLYSADGAVSIAGGAERRIPVDRAAAFPTLEKLIQELGPDIDGLLGLSALGDERIIVTQDALTVVLP